MMRQYQPCVPHNHPPYTKLYNEAELPLTMNALSSRKNSKSSTCLGP